MHLTLILFTKSYWMVVVLDRGLDESVAGLIADYLSQMKIRPLRQGQNSGLCAKFKNPASAPRSSESDENPATLRSFEGDEGR